jgi:hypothetical protein
MRARILLLALVGLGSLPAAGQAPRLLNIKDQQSAEEVVAGKRSIANAAWWGFNREDSTDSLQAAINSGAKTLVVPFMGDPWIVRPLQLRSQLEIVFQPGVLILAKKGEYRGGGDSLFTAVGQSNIVIRGYGATLRMHKREYQKPPYSKAEWRMGIALRGCRHVLIEGLRVESTGGDGFYVDGGGDLGWSQDITIRNCTAYDNHRQGLSVISVMNLLVDNCRFASTWGTAPEAGIDLEPDTEQNRLVNCVIRNSTFENNNGNGILVYLKPLTTNSEPVSIRFEHCWVRMTEARLTPLEPGPSAGLNGVAGIAVGAVKDNGPKGLIEFLDCVTENTGTEGARVYDKSATSARVRFVNCAFRNPWVSPAPGDGEPRVPIILHLRQPKNTENLGGIDFQDCYVYDSAPRPTVRFEVDQGDFGLRDVHGQIMAGGPGAPSLKLGKKLEDVDLRVIQAPK